MQDDSRRIEVDGLRRTRGSTSGSSAGNGDDAASRAVDSDAAAHAAGDESGDREVELESGSSVTRLLGRTARGDNAARSDLLELVYGELHSLADSQMRRVAAGHTLQPTALVHEAYLKLVRLDRANFATRRHFYALASRVMRAVLVDHARGKNTLKRGGPATAIRVDDQTPMPEQPLAPIDLFDLGLALEDLAELDDQLATAAELRYLAGLPVAEVAATMNLPVRTAERRLMAANAWLRDRFDDGGE